MEQKETVCSVAKKCGGCRYQGVSYPYKLLSGGSILMGIHGGDAFVQQLRREGIMAAVIGQTDSGNNRLLYSGGNARYLERPAEDETKKLGFLIS